MESALGDLHPMEAVGVNAHIWEMVGCKWHLSSEQIERCCFQRPRTKQNEMDPSESTAPSVWYPTIWIPRPRY